MPSVVGAVTRALALLGTGLTPEQQNGKSTLGLLNAPQLPHFLGTDTTSSAGAPWGSLTARSTLGTIVPNTGATRKFDFTVTRGVIAPDGVQKQVILINGKFPGPTIEANWGDQIQVTVHNNITSPAEGIAFHWHGFLQKKTQYYDGVPSVTQCPLPPGSTFVYNFQADSFGSSWYHSHFSAQSAGGLIGPMVIHGPSTTDYDVDLGPVMLTDWYHKPYLEVVEGLFNNVSDFNLFAPSSDNNFINGKNDFDCSLAPSGSKCIPNAPLAQFRFQYGKTHRLRLINAGAEAIQRFSIDGHTMTVIANDLTPIQPYNTTVVTLGIGQRTDILVTATVGTPGSSFWMRSNISTICSLTKRPQALAAIFYTNATTKYAPTSKAWDVPDPGTCDNDDLTLTKPLIPMPAISLNGSFRQDFNIDYIVNASNVHLWTMNGQTFRGDYNNPILLRANQGVTSFPAEQNVYNMYSNTSIIFVINNLAFKNGPPHPMHFHGHNFQVLHTGLGPWDGVSIINPSNPQRRDVQLLPGNGHIVLGAIMDNPGTWPLHCHIAWHVSSGLYVTILERPDDIRKIAIPEASMQNCQDWAAWTASNVPDQIDSGL